MPWVKYSQSDIDTLDGSCRETEREKMSLALSSGTTKQNNTIAINHSHHFSIDFVTAQIMNFNFNTLINNEIALVPIKIANIFEKTLAKRELSLKCIHLETNQWQNSSFNMKTFLSV